MKSPGRRKIIGWSLCVCLLLGTAAVVFHPRIPEDAVIVTFVRYDEKGVAVLQFSNRTRILLDLNYRTALWQDGAWRPMDRQPVLNRNSWWLGPHETRNLGAFPPNEPARWRVEVQGCRRDTQLEDWVEDISQALGMKVSFRHPYKTVAVLELEK